MTRPAVIHVEVSGLTATGKTAVMARIKKALEGDGYVVASPDLDAEIRMVTADHLLAAPRRHSTVIVLSETNEPRQAP